MARRSKEPELPSQNIPLLLDCLTATTNADDKPFKRGEAALHLWGRALAGEKQRELCFKGDCVPALVTLLDKGTVDERFAAMGCLQSLALSEKYFPDQIAPFVNKILMNSCHLMLGDHDRSRLPAVQFICQLAARGEYVSKVGDIALAPLVELLKHANPGWAASMQITYFTTLTLKHLVDITEFETQEVKQVRRWQLLQLGALVPLIRLIADRPRPVQAEKVVAVLQPNTSAAVTSGPGAPPRAAAMFPVPSSPSTVSMGSRDTIATAAAACVRYLALCPEFVPSLQDAQTMALFVSGLSTANDEQSAYLCGVLWEISADLEIADAVAQAGATPLLLKTIEQLLPSLTGKKGRRPKAASKAAAAAGGDKKKKKGGAVPPVSFAEAAVCNAAGALHHLTFLDTVKCQVAALRGVPLLLKLLTIRNPRTYENAVGALWNCGLEPGNSEAMMDAGAPTYLVKPVPDRWIASELNALLPAKTPPLAAPPTGPL